MNGRPVNGRPVNDTHAHNRGDTAQGVDGSHRVDTARTPGAGRRAARSAARTLREIEYPHGIHPALVSGVSVDDQRIRYGVDKPISSWSAP